MVRTLGAEGVAGVPARNSGFPRSPATLVVVEIGVGILRPAELEFTGKNSGSRAGKGVVMTGSEWRLAIDFGTSNTAASVVQGDGGVLVLRLGARSDAITSAVAVYNGEILAGEAAIQVAGIFPAASEPTPKRRLGENAVFLGGSVFDPVDLVAAVLRYVLNHAIRFAGGGVPSRVVLTHPEPWDAYMKQRLTAAAVCAGIPEQDLVLLPEPVAAAWHYAATSEIQAGAHIAVLDFGGGTCDAAVLKLSDTQAGRSFQVVSSGGIDPLGGHDFDAQLEKWVYSQLSAEGRTGLLQSLVAERAAADRAVLRDQVRGAKHALSFHSSAPIGVHSGDYEWVCTVTRHEFEQLIDSQISRAVELVQKVISDALPAMEELHRVYLTGGSSYIPALQTKLAELLPLKLGLMGDPKQVTSIGALQAPTPEQGPEEGQTQAPVARDRNKAADATDNAGAVTRPDITPNQPIPVQTSTAPASKPQGPGRSRKMLVAGGTVTAAVVLASAVVLSNALTGPGPAPTPSASAQACGGVSRGDLSASECELLNKSPSGTSLVAPESCISNPDPQGARSALVCDPASDSGFSPALQPKIYVYGYASPDALASSFELDIDSSSAAKGSITQPPAWEIWTLSGDTTTTQGRILSFTATDGSNVLEWTDEKALIKIRAESGATVDELYSWWQNKWKAAL